MAFVDPWKPEENEIFVWAYSDENWPEQDFDLALTDSDVNFLVKIAADKECPKRTFFIHALYVLVGDSVYMENLERQAELQTSIPMCNSFGDDAIEKWKTESLELLQGKMEFSYNYWCRYMFKDIELNADPKPIRNTNNIALDILLLKPKLNFTIEKCHKQSVCRSKIESLQLEASLLSINQNRKKYAVKIIDSSIKISTDQLLQVLSHPVAAIIFEGNAKTAKIQILPPPLLRVFLFFSSMSAVIFVIAGLFEEPINIYILWFVCIYVCFLYAMILIGFLPAAKEMKSDIIEAFAKMS